MVWHGPRDDVEPKRDGRPWMKGGVVTRQEKGALAISILFSITALLSWWRASQGLTGWLVISVVWTFAAVASWAAYLRVRQRKASEEPPPST
jgi:hypothetical protein